MTTKFTFALCIATALLVPYAAIAADQTPSDTDRSHPKVFVKDSVITTKIKTEYAKDKLVSAMKVEVETDHSGMVVLTGTAKSQAEADKAVAIAKGVQGVTSVQNSIKVEPAGSKPATKY